jgi:hypothetical protein
MHASYVSIARESNREIEVAGPPAGAPNRRDRLLAIFRPQSQARAESIGSFTPIGQASLPRRARTRALPSQGRQYQPESDSPEARPNDR